MSLESFFNPRSIAVVGASHKKGKVGYEILTNIVAGGFQGRVFPVNKNVEQIEGLKCYPDLESIGEVPELVIIVVPAPAVPEIMTQCGKIGTKAVVIITAGFKEVGKEGKETRRANYRNCKTSGHSHYRPELSRPDCPDKQT